MFYACALVCTILFTLPIGRSFGENLFSALRHHETPTVEQLLMRTKQAAGGSAWDRVHSLNITWKAQESGLPGSVYETDDLVGVRYRDRWDFGVRSGAFGFNGTIVWSQDSSGLSQIEEGHNTREGTINEAYRRSVAYWYPERWPATFEYKERKQEQGSEFHILKITPRGGRPFELWFDTSTYLLRRIVENTAIGVLNVWLEDYREIKNVKFAFVVRVKSSTGTENVYRAQKIVFNRPFSAARFDRPPPSLPDYSLGTPGSSVTLPMEVINNHTYIEGKLNGAGPYRFLIDTGWGTSSITPEVARALRLSTRGAQKTVGAGEGTAENAFTKLSKMQFGSVQLRNQSLLVTSAFDGKTRDGVNNFGGMLGYELFKRFVVTMDFERHTLTFSLPENFTAPGGMIVPFKLSNSMPLVHGEIDGVSGEFIIDSGFPGAIILYSNFVSKHDLANKFKPRFETITGWGIGGPVRAGVTRAGIFKMGDVNVSNSILTLSLLKSGTLADPYMAGAVGSEILKRFTVTFDYRRRQMIFVKNANYNTPDVFDRTGMYLNKAATGFEVMDVVVGGPADEAGIKVGDQILSLDGEPASRLSLPKARLKLKDAVNTRIKVTLKRASSTTDVVLVLRDLV